MRYLLKAKESGGKKNTYWNRQSNSHANLCSWHEDLGRSLQASNNVRKTPGCNVICRWVYLSASSARLAISRLIVRWTERLSFLFVVVGQRTFADKAHKVVRVELLLHCAHLGYVSQSKKKKAKTSATIRPCRPKWSAVRTPHRRRDICSYSKTCRECALPFRSTCPCQ